MRPAYVLVLSAAGGFVIGLTAAHLWAPGASSFGTDDSRSRTDARIEMSSPTDAAIDSEKRQALLFSLLDKPRDHSRDYELYGALQQLTASELKEGAPKMIAALKRLGEKHSFAEQVGEAWMERWLEVDTPGALEFLDSTRVFDELDPEGKWKQSFAIWALPFHGVFKAVARKDPEWTRNYLLTIKDESKREFGVHLLAVAAAEKLGSRGKDLIADFMEGGSRNAAVGGYAKGLAQSSASDAFQVILGESPGPFRNEVMQNVLWSASAGGSAAVLTLLDRIDDPLDRARMAGTAIGNVAHRAGENVRAWLEEEMKRADSLGLKKSGWSWDWAIQETVWVGDFGALADWGLNLEADKDHQVLNSLIGNWASRDPAEVQSWLGKNAGHLDEGAVKSLDGHLQHLVERDPQSTAKWAETLPDGALRGSIALKAALASAADGNSAHVIALYPALSAKDSTGAVAKRIATILSRADGKQAGEWALSLPPAAARDTVIREVADEWGQRDPVAAAQWLDEIPPGPERDGALVEYAANVTYADPAAGADWVLEIGSEDFRQHAAERVYWTWRNEDPGAATAWIRQLPGVSEEWRQQTLRVRR